MAYYCDTFPLLMKQLLCPSHWLSNHYFAFWRLLLCKVAGPLTNLCWFYDGDYLLLQRNLVYTGVTRGKKLVGQRKALAIAVRNNKAESRFSGLLDRWRQRKNPL